MRVLCTFPGKFGDLLWALPTVRAISRRIGAPVDLMLAAPFASIVPLLSQQAYLGRVWADRRWDTHDTAPISPRAPSYVPRGVISWDVSRPAETTYTYDVILHLGYREWPTPDLVRHTLRTAQLELGNCDYRMYEELNRELQEAELDLGTPWITVPDPATYDLPWCYGFTDEHFELKYGLVQLLTQVSPKVRRAARFGSAYPPTQVGSSPRWVQEADSNEVSWLDTAALIGCARAFLGDCSALHVLAVAMGKPAILMEPNPHRHNSTFYPLGDQGPQVTLVRGTDGLPTFDARHVADALRSVLSR